MIRKIRKRHRFIWLILAISLPIIFIASIVFRHRETFNENVPKRILPQSSQRTQSEK
jgi:hypothetical protein